jgi:uncharacterized ferredoxin-like protein
MIKKSEDAERDALRTAADAMMAAARTAPKGCGMDNVVTAEIDGSDIDALADEMMKIHEETGLDFFKRDSGNARNSGIVVLIGVKDSPLGMPHCGMCGFKDCAESRKAGARCVFNLTDLGIAIGSAVSKAADGRVDSRVYYSMGKAAQRLGILGDDVKNVFGIGLSISSKSIYFDREPRKIMQ